MGVAATGVLSWSVNQPGQHWYDSIFYGPVVVGVLASGNVHQPNQIVVWCTLFVMCSALTYALWSTSCRSGDVPGVVRGRGAPTGKSRDEPPWFYGNN